MLAAPQVLALAAPLLGWSMYRRIKRNISRQPVQPRRLIARSVFIVIVMALLLRYPSFDPVIAAAMFAGCACGIPLALYGVQLTRFETTHDGQFYTPNLILGIGISLIFITRMIYRLVVLYPLMQSGNVAAYSSGPRSALTYSLLGLVLGYFATYSFGVMRSARRRTQPVSAA